MILFGATPKPEQAPAAVVFVVVAVAEPQNPNRQPHPPAPPRARQESHPLENQWWGVVPKPLKKLLLDLCVIANS